MQLELITINKLLEEWDKGRRDFSNTKLINVWTDGKNFDGIIFKNCVFNSSRFSYCSFIKADFSGSQFEWSGLINSNLTNANFQNIHLRWSSFQDSDIKNAGFKSADIDWGVFVGTNWDAADFRGAKIGKMITGWGNMTNVDWETLLSAISSGAMSGQLRQLIKSRIEAAKEATTAAERFQKFYATGSLKSTEVVYRPRIIETTDRSSYVSRAKSAYTDEAGYILAGKKQTKKLYKK